MLIRFPRVITNTLHYKAQGRKGKFSLRIFPVEIYQYGYILVPTAHDPSGLRQEWRAVRATISGMRHRCRLPETGWAEFGDFLCYFKMVAPRALVFQPLVKGNEALGTRLVRVLLKIRLVFWFSVF